LPPAIYRSIIKDNPSHPILLKYPYVGMKEVKSSKESFKGLVNRMRTPQGPLFYLAGAHLPRGVRCNAVQIGLEKGVHPQSMNRRM